MSASRHPLSEPQQHVLATSLAALTNLVAWYPFFEISLRQRAEILSSNKPNDLSHTNFFQNKRNFYRAVFTNMATMIPLFPAVEFALGSALQTIASHQQREANFSEKWAASFAIGGITAFIANPYEVVNISAQRHNEAPHKALARILTNDSASSLFQGTTPMAFRNAFFTSSIFTTTPAINAYFKQVFPGESLTHHLLTTTLSAAVPASLFTVIVIPFDIAAIMRQADPSKKLIKSAPEALKLAYHKHGFAALKAGTLFRLIACNLEMIGFNVLREEYSKRLA